MSKVAEDRLNWLDQVKADAEKSTKRRLEDDGFNSHVERQKEINDAEAAAKEARDAEVDPPKSDKK